MSYQPYPTSGQTPEPQQRPPAPNSVQTAVKLMYAGAALSLIELIVSLATIASLKSAILKKYPNYTSTQIHSAEVAIVAGVVIEAVIAIGLWLWMAWANGNGRSWARVVSAVFFGINTLDLLISLFAVHAVATLIIGVAIWLVGLAAIVLIFSKESRPFYNRQSA